MGTEEVPLKIYRNSGINDEKRNYLDVGLRGNGIGTNFYGVGSIIRVIVDEFKYEKTGKIRVGSDGGNTNSIFAHFGIIDKNKKKKYYQSNQDCNVKAKICVNWMGKEETNECWDDIDLNQRIILDQSIENKYNPKSISKIETKYNSRELSKAEKLAM